MSQRIPKPVEGQRLKLRRGVRTEMPKRDMPTAFQHDLATVHLYCDRRRPGIGDVCGYYLAKFFCEVKPTGVDDILHDSIAKRSSFKLTEESESCELVCPRCGNTPRMKMERVVRLLAGMVDHDTRDTELGISTLLAQRL